MEASALTFPGLPYIHCLSSILCQAAVNAPRNLSLISDVAPYSWQRKTVCWPFCPGSHQRCQVACLINPCRKVIERQLYSGSEDSARCHNHDPLVYVRGPTVWRVVVGYIDNVPCTSIVNRCITKITIIQKRPRCSPIVGLHEVHLVFCRIAHPSKNMKIVKGALINSPQVAETTISCRFWNLYGSCPSICRDPQ